MSNQQGQYGQNNQGGEGWTPDVFSDDKLYLYGKPIQEGGWNPRMRVKKRGNNPCLEISTGLKDKKDRQIKNDIPMAPRVFEELLYVLETVATYNSSISFELENWGYQYKWNPQTNKSERGQEVEVIARISITKDESGMIGLIFAFRGGKTIVPFYFEADQYHKWMRGGNYLSDADQSKIAAISWAKMMREVYTHMYLTEWKEPEWQKQKRIERMNNATGGNGGNNYSQRQGNSGGGNNQYQQRQTTNQAPSNGGGDAFSNSFGSGMSFDDDIPL